MSWQNLKKVFYLFDVSLYNYPRRAWAAHRYIVVVQFVCCLSKPAHLDAIAHVSLFSYRECIPSSIKQVKAKFAANLYSYLTGFSVESDSFLVVAISRRSLCQKFFHYAIAHSLKFHVKRTGNVA